MLQQHDVNELLTTLLASQETESAKGSQFAEVKIYDFARPDNVPSEFIHRLETINNTFARNLSTMLTGFLSLGAQVDSLSVDQLTFRQFCNAVPEISAACTFSLSPLDGYGLLEINSPVAWYLIDRGLGGPGEIIDSPRPFTALAKGLLDDLMRRVLKELARAWEPLLPLQPKLRDVISEPSMAHIGQQEDSLLVSTFNVTFAEVNGLCTYCIPVFSLDFESLLNTQGAAAHEAIEDDPEYQRSVIVNCLLASPVSLRACLPDIALSLDELSSLQEGDVIPFSSSPEDLVEVRVVGQRSFWGRPVTIDDQVAIEIFETAEEHCE